MGLTSIPTYATGDTIEAGWANTLRDNAIILDVRTGGDPGTASKLLVSASSVGGAWLTAGANGKLLVLVSGAPAWADLPTDAAKNNLGYTPANKAGDTFLADVGFNTVIRIDGRTVYLNTAVTRYLQYDSSGDRYILGGVVPLIDAGAHVYWNSNNDGASSGLDADTVDGIQAAAFAQLNGAIFTADVVVQGSGVLRLDNRTLYLNSAVTRYLQYDTSGDRYILGGAVALVDASGHVYWNSNNDGASSGLDADTLDGHDTGHSSGNIPIADTGLVTGLNAELHAGVLVTQLARLSAASNFTVAPTINSNTVWTAGNDGIGSGLDADLVQGVNGSNIARKQTGTYTGAGTGINASFNVATNFSPVFTVITGSSDDSSFLLVGTAEAIGNTAGLAALCTGTHNGTNVFHVNVANGGPNQSGVPYTWTAFG